MQCFVAEAEIAETKHFREFRERFVRHRSGRSTAFGSRGSSTRSRASIRQSPHQPLVGRSGIRQEGRRDGKEGVSKGRSRWAREHEKKQRRMKNGKELAE